MNVAPTACTPSPSDGAGLDGRCSACATEPRAAAPAQSVVVADDSAFIRQVVLLLVDTCPGLDVVGEADSGAAAVEACRALRPDWLVLDHDLGDSTAGEVLTQLSLSSLQPKVLLHSARSNVQEIATALGCAAAVDKARTVELLTCTLLDHATAPRAMISGGTT